MQYISKYFPSNGKKHCKQKVYNRRYRFFSCVAVLSAEMLALSILLKPPADMEEELQVFRVQQSVFGMKMFIFICPFPISFIFFSTGELTLNINLT